MKVVKTQRWKFWTRDVCCTTHFRVFKREDLLCKNVHPLIRRFSWYHSCDSLFAPGPFSGLHRVSSVPHLSDSRALEQVVTAPTGFRTCVPQEISWCRDVLSPSFTLWLSFASSSSPTRASREVQGLSRDHGKSSHPRLDSTRVRHNWDWLRKREESTQQ